MALGLLLRVSWIYLLFDCSAGSPAPSDYRYPSNGVSRKQDEVLNPKTFDQRDWQALNNQPIDPVYTRDEPSGAQLSDSVPSPENLPDTQGSGVMANPFVGHLSDWSLENPERLLMFPLNHKYQQNNPAMPQPNPIQAEYLYEDAGASNTAGHYMSTGSSTSPPKKGSYPSKPAKVGAWPVYPSGMGSPASWFAGGANPNFGKLQKPVVGPQKSVVTQRVSEPIRPHYPPPPPPSYIVQSRNGYQRASYLHSNSRYSPDVPHASSMGSG